MNKSESGIPNPEVPRQKLDVLIVLGHNLGAGWPKDRIRRISGHLSGQSKLNVFAAALLFKKGVVDSIIFSSGHTSGSETPSEAEAMEAFLKTRFPEIPSSVIILEDISIDTAGNAEESVRIVNQQNFNNVGLLSTGDHVKNAAILFERYGLKIKKENRFSSENVVAENMAKNPELFLECYKKSFQTRRDHQKELVRTILLHTADRKGMLARQISKRTRK